MRLVRSLLVAVAVCGVAAGCSGSGEPTPGVAPSPPSPPSPSTTEAPPEPSPTQSGPAKPVLPAAATVPDAAGAEAYVRWFYELMNYAYATGDSDAITSVSHVDCVACVNLRENIDSATDVGAVWQDLTFTPEQFEAAAPDADGLSLVTALVIRSPDPTVLQADGTVVDVSGTEAESIRFLAQWTGDHWQTFELSFPDRPQ